MYGEREAFFAAAKNLHPSHSARPAGPAYRTLSPDDDGVRVHNAKQVQTIESALQGDLAKARQTLIFTGMSTKGENT